MTIARSLARLLIVFGTIIAATGCSESGAPPGADADIDIDADGDSDSDSDSDSDTDTAGCNLLASEWDCLLPYPSDFFLVEDAALPSGRRLRITGAARLVRPDRKVVEPYEVHPADGFSHHPPILALFPGGVNPTNLVFHTGDVTASLGPDSPTVLLDADSGARVLHFAELDPRAEDDARRALLIRPLERLRNDTHYIVAIRDLRDPGGAVIAPPEGFRKIRDDEVAGDPGLASLAARYEQDLFPALGAAGVERANLQLAWDFTTQSETHVTGDMLALRSDLIERLEQSPPAVTILEVTEDVSEQVLRHVEGTIRVPLYVDSTEHSARLNRNAAGAVIAVGEAEVPFSLRIPRSLEGFTPGQDPARVLQYGHSFFGGRDEIERGWLMELADRFGFVVVTVDWWGMSRSDVAPMVGAIASKPSEMLVLTDRLHQGLANQIALSYAVAGPLATQDAAKINGAAVIDPTQIYYYGCSQGGILGGTYAPLAPKIERAVLGVGGASITLMMFRSRNFSDFLALMDGFTPDPLDEQKWVALLPTTFDRVDPVTYASHAIRDLYPGGPDERRVLMHNGIGDTDVTDLAAHLLARTIGVSLLQPAPQDVPGLPPVAAPHGGSALVIFDFGVPEPLPGTVAEPPLEGNEVHNGIRKLDASMKQIDAFLRPGGRIEQFCDGICDPE